MTSVEVTTLRRYGPLVGAVAGIVLAMVVLGPRVGPIGTGTLIALVVAVLATRHALNTDRPTRLD